MDLKCFDGKKVKYDQSTRFYGPLFKLPPVLDKKVRALGQASWSGGGCRKRRERSFFFFLTGCSL